ncbi:uncharacterized protein EI97DRAFT_272066 [Westerdykella ornata]|uniref:Uncharacterized protein n=1 Tax=Westerdykella ornata TaxID=318751 RepID=A0A6A6JMN0_WESOR|nr:uncharacterized protein EI97DRAFT_272066 [Westerdykella ornata]KAF2277752.1 hypothetical protein EI97DRAFT_272066 [Westerdykella ornata]
MQKAKRKARMEYTTSGRDEVKRNNNKKKRIIKSRRRRRQGGGIYVKTQTQDIAKKKTKKRKKRRKKAVQGRAKENIPSGKQHKGRRTKEKRKAKKN